MCWIVPPLCQKRLRVFGAGVATSCALYQTCSAATPLSYLLHSAGPAASTVNILAWALIALCSAVSIAVALLLVVAIAKRRGSLESQSIPETVVTDGSPEHSASREHAANRIVIAGTAVSTGLLFVALIGMLRVLAAIAEPPRSPSVSVTVTAYDWWWKVTYTMPDGNRFVTANEIHIPAGEPVEVNLSSADVVHAFWVPALAGKTQAIPGQANRQWLQADHAGVWRGQCTQFCGPQHAHMAMEVVAETPEAYERWLVSEGSPAAAPGNPAALRGEQIFESRCAACHAVRGTSANGAQAPDLTHLASRRLIAAGTLVNTSANRIEWIEHAQRIKPASLMPDFALTHDEAIDLGAWLDTLQ
ncbi:cytochrome c oxidase subunit 2 [Paraburkholderia eburnea]|uniref:Cytochrome aa3 subunit 2 n=1 Tax=Paraburkholderia eburnea TaxID=1189126 RepID=A0A2S4LTQ9_9BURK|nr:cytochrome c oxidase subunit 2 [Paraburkholderia eburnea]PRZ14677.1 cytochrome c oxidase subunit 2 [Paraburkholderia eburnea]